MDKRDKFKLKGNTIAGTFRVDEVVAEGGFGIVYRAFHLHFRAPVALKCLKIPGELSDDDRQNFLEQFRSEAEIQFRLSAALPNIVRPLHVDAVRTEDGGFIPMMALEWLEGTSFETIIESRTFSDKPPMPLVEVIDLIGPAAEALHQAHNFESGGETLAVIHRDIKPDNLFLTEINGKRVVKILDFGISKVRRAATQLAGHFSQTAGTAPFSPAYGAPEQWVPKRFGQTGPWTDVWGLALTLVEIIKGDAVIIGDHQAMMGTALDPKVRPTPRSEGVTVSDEVESVFLKALSLDPRFRYQSIQAFWEALEAAVLLSEENGHAYDETPSGSRIPLPPMSAPTPWQSPADALKEANEPIGVLPPMLAPALMEPTSIEEEQLEPDASYPFNPMSDLMPVPAAPTNWSHFDPEVPPSSGEPDHLMARAHSDTAPRPIAPLEEREPLAPPPPEFTERKDPSIKLELAETSRYPQPAERLEKMSDLTALTRAKAKAKAQAMAPINAPPIPDLTPPDLTPQPAQTAAPRAPTANQALRPPPPRRSKERPPPPNRRSQATAAPTASAGPPPPPKRAARPQPPRPSKSKDEEEKKKPLSLIPTRGRRSIG